MTKPPPPTLTTQQQSLVNSLSSDFIETIDKALLSHASVSWKKVAMLVGLVMIDDNIRMPGLPDLFYASRVKHLVENGRLESQGDLAHMRYSEVRLPQPQP